MGKQPFSDVLIVGAGAAGMATAIFVAHHRPDASITLLEGARSPGAKILVSGGGRCNVSNARVTEADFNGGTRGAIGLVLRAFPVARTVEFFAGIGVPLHEEEGGKLFPDSNRARTVLDALLGEITTRGVRLLTGRRAGVVTRVAEGFEVQTPAGPIHSRRLVLANGGRSLPKSGSDGNGYCMAERLGHTVVPTTPALVPLLLETGPHAELSGISQPVELTLLVEGKRSLRIAGPLLWTHFGVSGPAVLDISRHWLQAHSAGLSPSLEANLLPGLDFPRADNMLVELTNQRPRMAIANALSQVPAGVAAAVTRLCGLPPAKAAGHLTREERRRLAGALTSFPLGIKGSRGYTYAEVTAGGVALPEVDPRSMQSRICPGLFFAGEILDVDGRIGGFNFQWAWASAKVAAQGLAGL